MPEDDLVELKFRLYDGTDIGPMRYAASATVAMLKERVLSDWPRACNIMLPYACSCYSIRLILLHSLSLDKKVIPKAANDLRLISGGKILENNKTVAQCRIPFGELPGGVITMHVVIQPSGTKMKTEKPRPVPKGEISLCAHRGNEEGYRENLCPSPVHKAKDPAKFFLVSTLWRVVGWLDCTEFAAKCLEQTTTNKLTVLKVILWLSRYREGGRATEEEILLLCHSIRCGGICPWIMLVDIRSALASLSCHRLHCDEGH
ncbi:hypothetical protein Taro_013091, partial [Colocasia esculenta]|nr:hypothetical protein [Colocasia esculenta]